MASMAAILWIVWPFWRARKSDYCVGLNHGTIRSKRELTKLLVV